MTFYHVALDDHGHVEMGMSHPFIVIMVNRITSVPDLLDGRYCSFYCTIDATSALWIKAICRQSLANANKSKIIFAWTKRWKVSENC